MLDDRPGGGSLRFAAAVLAASVLAPLPVVRGGDRPNAGDGRAAAVVASCLLPATVLAASTAAEPAVMLGGISDLFVERNGAGRWRAWGVTDRGPNGLVDLDGSVKRTLVSPSFAPRIVEFSIAWDTAHPDRLDVAVTGMTTLRDRDGVPLTGRPNGLAADPCIVDPRGEQSIAADPDGVDTEGLVRTRDGAWWLAEEYRPSLLAAAADGTVGRRFVPAGQSLVGAGMDVEDSLPGPYAERRDNRGFEALAIAADDSRIFALLQSPLERPDRETAERIGNVRLLLVDPVAGLPASEHVYRLGEPPKGRRQKDARELDDGKLCAMAAVGRDSLLVLEQAAGGVVRLYLAELGPATDTLPRTGADDEPPLESLRELDEAGITPVKKTLLADLGSALEGMRAHAGLGGDDARPLKIEGLAVADERHVFLVNDDDFGVREDTDSTPVRSCLWVVRLPRPIPLTSP